MNPQDFYKRWGAVASEPDYQFELTQQGLRPRGQQARPQPQAAPKQKGNSLLKTLLSIGGGTIGGIAGTIVAPGVGTAIGAGLGSGLGTAAGRALGGEAVIEDGGLGEIALDTVLGGAFGGAGKAAKAAKSGQAAMTIAGKGIGKRAIEDVAQGAAVSVGKEGAQNFAGKIGRGSVVSRGASTLPTATAQDEVLKLSQAYPQYFKGSGKAKFNNVDRFISDKVDEVDSLLAPVKQTVPTANLQREFRGYSQTLSGTPEGRQFDNLTKTIFAPLQGKQELTAIEVNNMRRQINKKFPNMFSKNAKGGQLTGAETAASEIRDMLGKTIDDLGGDAVRPINREIAIANQARPEFKRLSEQVSTARVPFIQSPVPGLEGMRQSGLDRVGRIGAGPAKPLTLTGALTRQGGREMLTGGFTGEQAMPVEDTMMQEEAPVMGYAVGQDGTIEPITGDTGMEGMGDMGNDPNAQLRQQLQQAMIDDLQLTGGENVSKLKTVLSVLGEPDKMSAAGTKAQVQQESVLNKVGQLSQLFSQAGGGSGRIGGGIRGVAGAVGGDEMAYNYNQYRDSLLAPLARAVSGEVGVLTDRDIKRADGLLPKLTDTPAEAERRLQLLMESIQGQRSVNQRIYAGGNGQSSLSDVMYNMEGLQ